MRKFTRPAGHDDNALCPMFTTLNLIANKWTVRLVYSLLHAENRTMRFGVLKKAMDGISQRELTKHLREYERVGIVSRRVYPEIPPRVEYTLTPLGETLFMPINALSDWAVEHGAALKRNRAQFDRRQADAA